jgi:hypothetical protein
MTTTGNHEKESAMLGATAAKFYAKQTYNQLNRIYRPTWMPNERIEIGDIGLLQRGVFRRLASFEDQIGERIDVLPDPDPSPFELTFSKATKLVFKAAGETKADLPNIPAAKAGFGVEFSRKGAFVVRAEESFEPSVRNIIHLQERVVQLFAAGEWDKNWVVVVKMVSCPAAAILISKSKSTKLEFSVSGDVPAAGVVLGSASSSFQLEASTNAGINLVDARNVTPFVQLLTLGEQVFEGVRSGRKVAGEAAGPPLPPLARLTPEALAKDEELIRSLALVPAVDIDDDLVFEDDGE